MANTAARGTLDYMSPELKLIYSRSGFGEFNPEKSDIFSTGLTFLRFSLLLPQNGICEMNNFETLRVSFLRVCFLLSLFGAEHLRLDLIFRHFSLKQIVPLLDAIFWATIGKHIWRFRGFFSVP